MTSFYGSVNSGQGGGGEGIDTSTLMQKNDPTFNGTLTGPNAHFTGTVQIPEPTEDNHAATKAYVDAALADVDLSEITTRMDAIETAQDELAAQLDDKVDAENPAFTGTATLNGKNIATIDQIPNVSDLPYLDENNPTYTGNLTGENAAFSGTVTVATPTAEGEAANKGYVDSAKTELEGDISTLQQTVNTINQQVTNITSGTEELPYLKNIGDSGTGVYDFTGATVNAADPVDNSNVATKHYVDQKVASAGGTGEVVSYTQGDGISISPENEISLSIDSAGANGLKVGANGLGLDLATDTTPGAMAASDKTAIASNTTDITNIKNGTTELPYLKETNPTYEGTLIGGDATFTGSVQISTPDQDNEAANKSYVDTAVAASDETIQQIQTDIDNIENGTTDLPYIKDSGDTVTGSYDFTGATLNIAEPISNTNPATKSYVDTKIAGIGEGGEVVAYTNGNGITISAENVISVNVNTTNSNGLGVDINGLKLDLASSTTAGAMSSTDKIKLDAVPTIETVESSISEAINTLGIDEVKQDITSLETSIDNIPVVSVSETNGSIKIDEVDTTVYTHPVHTEAQEGFYKVAVDTQGHVTATTPITKEDITILGIPAQDTTYTDATTTKSGLMSATDKIALNTAVEDIVDIKENYVSNGVNNVAKGNPAVCEDSVEWPLLGLKVFGKSTQVKTNGYQLFDSSSVKYGYRWSSTGLENVESNAEQYWASAPIPVVAGSSYTVTKQNSYRNFYLDESKSVLEEIGAYQISAYPYTFTVPENAKFVVFTGKMNPEDEGAVPINPKNVMLNSGSVALPFEPYTGGKPSPSPEYPQEIHSAGDDGEIDVVATGENILNPDWIDNVSNNTLFSCRGLKPGNYTISFVSTADWWTNNENNNTWFINYYDKNDEEIDGADITFADAAINVRSHGNFTIPQGTDKIRLNVYSSVTKASVTDLMLNIGLAVLPYEPYQSQSLTFQTLNGLPGIPVDSGGNFVDADGQQWICNYRDWARGVDVKCVETIAGPEITYINIGQDGGSWLTTGETIPFYVDYSQFNKPKSIANYGFCTYFTYNEGIVSNDNEGFFMQAGRSYFAFRLLKSRLVEYGYDDSDQVGTGPSAFLAWLNAHNDLQIFYAVSFIEIPIPADELAAYRALHTYDGTTVISSPDSLAEIEFNYISQNQINLPYIKNKGDIVSGEYDFTSANVKVAEPTENNNVATKNYVDEAINKFYHAQVLTATSKETVDNLFASWWKTKWVEGVTTYNSMLEDWFANVLYDDRIHGVKLPLWETSHSQKGEYTDDSVGLVCQPSTADYTARDDFAYLPQFWCVEVAVEKNADYTHTIYACEFIDDINIVRAGGPNDGKHLVWVLQKNTYRREWEEEGYKYLKTRCTPAEGYTTWLQGTDNSGRVYPYVGIPKYAAGIEEDGTIGSRAGLKPAIFESYDSGIQKWQARGSQYTGGSYLTLKWQLDMIALKYASKGNSNGIEGCVNFNIQTPVLIAESNANRVIINQDQANNFIVGQYINIGSGNRLASETNVLITNIETVNISETDYLALTFEGSPIETTTAQKVCSLAWPADLVTNHIQGNDGQAFKGQTVTGLIQKTEFLNGAHLITSDEKWKWDAASDHEDGSRTFECYICEDANNITTGNSFENYTLAASINLPADYNNSSKYITDIVTTDKQILFPKAVSNEAGSTTGYGDCMQIYFADNAMRAPWHCGYLWVGSGAGLAGLGSLGGSSGSYWYGGVGAPGLAK